MRRILFTGRGTGGSWKIRGEQMGFELGAMVGANVRGVGRFDVVVAVKRINAELLAAMRALNGPKGPPPIVWDVVDSWPQPDGNFWNEENARNWVAAQLDRIRPARVIAPTERFCDDLVRWRLMDRASIKVIPHHSNPMYAPVPPRREIKLVAYEGGEQYIAGWTPAIQSLSAARGWRFEINPPNLAAADVILCLRSQRGYPARHWKSAVKLTNAHALGIPAICSSEAGYRSMSCGVELWADDVAELGTAFDALGKYEDRKLVSAVFAAHAFRIPRAAALYRELFDAL